MSYILDALRKSEQERDRRAAPDIGTLHGPAPVAHSAGGSSIPRWLVPAVLVALAVNAALLLWWYAQSDAGDGDLLAQPPAPSAPPAAAPTPPVEEREVAPPGSEGRDEGSTGRAQMAAAAPTADVAVQETQGDRRSAPDGQATRRETSTAAAVPSGEPPSATTESPATLPRASGAASSPAATAAPNTVPTPAATPAATPESPPPRIQSIRELPQRVQRRIPNLEFATHLYGNAAQFREVTINGVRYAEGDRVEGMRLEAITETGVVFRFEDYRFEISVLEDWDY